jgi:hypothetical protein
VNLAKSIRALGLKIWVNKAGNRFLYLLIVKTTKLFLADFTILVGINEPNESG